MKTSTFALSEMFWLSGVACSASLACALFLDALVITESASPPSTAGASVLLVMVMVETAGALGLLAARPVLETALAGDPGSEV